jgi:alpha-ketoglutarate-dependent taurine dioxygenase
VGGQGMPWLAVTTISGRPLRVAVFREKASLCRDRAFHVSMMLQPGDMQFVNNYHVLHARDAYEDRRAEGRIRHLKRLWLETDLLADEDKPEPFRLKQTAGNWWSSKGWTKSELDM